MMFKLLIINFLIINKIKFMKDFTKKILKGGNVKCLSK